MGAVWRAHDELLDRQVAVKELRLPDRLTPAERDNWIARVDREARAAARLKHPGIITVHDRITGEDGRPWIVMELVRGTSLDDLLREQGPLPVDRVVRIGLQAAAALRAAHQAGITHRDIKPANILLEDERVVLTDFGIAAVDGDATLTASGMLVGTPAYMAPEQVRGLPATAASDLWALGATLHTAVEGQPPFSGGNPGAVLVSVATDEPAVARHAGPLAPVLGALLHKDPGARLTLDRLEGMLKSLDGVVGDPRPVTAAPAPQGFVPTTTSLAVPPRPAGPPVVARVPVPPPRRPSRRRRALTGAALGFVLAAGAAGGYGLYVHYTLGSKKDVSRDDTAYQANVRTARALGAPEGFRLSEEQMTTEGKARITYTASSPCTGYCRDQGTAVVKWLSAKPNVKYVLPPRSVTSTGCHAPGDCHLFVRTLREPNFTDGQFLVDAKGQVSFRVEVWFFNAGQTASP